MCCSGNIGSEQEIAYPLHILVLIIGTFWLRFSTSVHQVQKYHTSIQDLHSELLNLKGKKHEGSGKHLSLESDFCPIYTRLGEILTNYHCGWNIMHYWNMKFWVDSHPYCSIEDAISRILNAVSIAEKTELSEYRAAKFQGENK